MFEAQTECFLSATVRVLFDCGIMQTFYFSDEVPGWGSFFFTF